MDLVSWTIVGWGDGWIRDVDLALWVENGFSTQMMGYGVNGMIIYGGIRSYFRTGTKSPGSIFSLVRIFLEINTLKFCPILLIDAKYLLLLSNQLRIEIPNQSSRWQSELDRGFLWRLWRMSRCERMYRSWNRWEITTNFYAIGTRKQLQVWEQNL